MVHTGPPLDMLSSGWFWVEEKIQGPNLSYIRRDHFFCPQLPATDLTEAAIQGFVHYVFRHMKGDGTISNLDCVDRTLTNLMYADLRSVASDFSSLHLTYIFFVLLLTNIITTNSFKRNPSPSKSDTR